MGWDVKVAGAIGLEGRAYTMAPIVGAFSIDSVPPNAGFGRFSRSKLPLGSPDESNAGLTDPMLTAPIE